MRLSKIVDMTACVACMQGHASNYSSSTVFQGHEGFELVRDANSKRQFSETDTKPREREARGKYKQPENARKAKQPNASNKKLQKNATRVL